MIADWKNRDEKLGDGYDWIYESISQLDFTFIPSNEVPNIESKNLDFEIGELDSLEYPSSMKHYKSGLITQMNLKGKYCFYKSVIYAVAGKTEFADQEIQEIAKRFNWKGVNKEGPVRREDINFG